MQGKPLSSGGRVGIISRLPFQGDIHRRKSGFSIAYRELAPGLLLCMVFQPARGIGIKSLPHWPNGTAFCSLIFWSTDILKRLLPIAMLALNTQNLSKPYGSILLWKRQ